MADNLNIDAGSTLTVATDVINNVHYQRVKIAHGDDGTASDAGPTAPLPVTVISATLGTVTLSSTASTITNAAGNPVNVALTNTKVTIDNTPINVNVATATLGTVTVTGTVTPSTTASTITNAAGNPVPVTGNVNIASATLGTVAISGTVSLSSTSVTVNNGTSINVNVATATLGTVTVTGTVTPSTTASTIANAAGNPVNVALTATNVTVNVGRIMTGSSGSFTATNATLFTPSARAKVYAFSLTTTCPTELICIFHTGGLELWRDTLMAPAGASAGANLAVSPPAFLFASRSGTAVSLSISSAVLIHWSISLFDEV